MPLILPYESRKGDFNDLYCESGLDALKERLKQELQRVSNQNHNSKLQVLTIKDFLSKQLAEREYIINPILPKQGLIMIYAKRGIGKTFFALLLACKMASGTNLFNDRWKINKKWKVLYIDGEMPANTMQQRLSSLLANFDKEEDNNNLSIITPDLQEYGLMPNIAAEEGQQELEPYVAQSDIIVIDNLSTLCKSGKENESNSWIPIQEWALRLRSQGKSVIFIHHAGKNNDQRGTSKREDILDTVINLKRPDDYDSKQGARFEIHFEKSRGFAGDDAKAFEIKLDLDNDKINWQISEIEDLQLSRVIELSEMKMSQRDIATEMNISASTVNRLLKKAKEAKNDK